MKIKRYTELIDAMLCARCGLPQWEWDPVWENEGYVLYGRTYCCKGCAHDIGCTCLISEFDGDGTAAQNIPRGWNAGRDEDVSG